MNRSSRAAAIALTALLGMNGVALVQTFQASVSCIANEATGAVVPSVKITITGIARGVAVNTTANQDGIYVINNLIPSTYRVSAEAAGFQICQLNSFPLTAKQEAVLNITAQPIRRWRCRSRYRWWNRPTPRSAAW